MRHVRALRIPGHTCVGYVPCVLSMVASRFGLWGEDSRHADASMRRVTLDSELRASLASACSCNPRLDMFGLASAERVHATCLFPRKSRSSAARPVDASARHIAAIRHVSPPARKKVKTSEDKSQTLGAKEFCLDA